jgi:hypothetical protein
MDAERQESLVRKIRGLLAKASDTGIPEAEQDTYRNHARKLMEQYCIEYVSEIPEHDVVIEEFFKPYAGLIIDRSLYPVLPHILLPIANYCGCMIICRHTEKGRVECFVGFKPNIEMAQYTANVVLKQGRDEFKRLYKEFRSCSFGQSFWSGFALGIEKKFALREQPSEKGVVLYDRTKDYVMRLTEGRTRNNAIDLSRPDMTTHGTEVGENVRVWKPVEGKGGGFLS